MALVELPPGEDASEYLVDRVREACAARTPLRIVGGDTKRFYGREVTGEVLSVAGHRGVLRYDPAELVITARGGTPLAEIEALLARHGQRLPFEPPAFGVAATIGGTVAAGIAGPARIVHGPVRDYVLGVKLLTGEGRVLRFGGEVMKNVAGYDVSRLLAGSLGILGVLLEVSLKVLPLPQATVTVRRHETLPGLADRLRVMTERGDPASSMFWHADQLHVRLEGSPASIAQRAQGLEGEFLDPGTARAFWQSVRDQQHSFFAGPPPWWRLSLRDPDAVRRIELPGIACEWNGRQAWVSGVDRATIELAAGRAGGDVTRFRAATVSPADDEVFPPLAPALLELHRSVKRVFDPSGILNPGRMYAGL